MSWWVEEQNYWYCRPCLKYSKSIEKPSIFRNQGKGKFGIIQKLGRKDFHRKLDNNAKINHRMSEHNSYPLHQWCVEKEKQVSENAKVLRDLEFEAGMNMVRNVLFTLQQPAGSAEEFVRLMNKDNLVKGSIVAHKNDSRIWYFRVRDICYEKLQDIIQDLFIDVPFIHCSLDKVTEGGQPYTVLVTYFFHNGAIRHILNELFVMTKDDLNAIETAKFVANCLMSSLGWSKEKLAERLESFAADGVYMSQDIRVRGGGSLSLAENIAEYLNLGPGIIKSNWDLAHQLELVVNDVLVNESSDHCSKYQESTNVLGDFMKAYLHDKKSLIWTDLSDKLRIPDLKNKLKSGTRFARYNVEWLITGCRNVGVYLSLLGRLIDEANREKNNTKMKSLVKERDTLFDAGLWLRIVGYIQIFSVIVELSEFSQSSTAFCTSVIEKYKE